MRGGAAVFLLLAPLTSAQTFDTVQVQPASGGEYVHPLVAPRSFLIVAPLFDIAEWAFDVRSYQMAGWPDWTKRQYYRIEGATVNPATQLELRRMLQTLLTERFQLKVHRNLAERDVFTLNIGPSGPLMDRSYRPCGIDGCIDVRSGEAMWVRFAKTRDIAATLSNMVDRPVLDRTDLDSRYEFRIEFDPASLPHVLEERLGLKLIPTRVTIEMLVVDTVGELTPN